MVDSEQMKTIVPVPVVNVSNGSLHAFVAQRAQRYVLTFRFGSWVSWCSRGTFGSLTRCRDTKFIIGFDFGVTLSALTYFCVLFDITSEQTVGLKWLMLNTKRWFHSSRVKFHLVSLSASWFLVSMCLIWILGFKLIPSNNQSRATVGSGNMSHCRASTLVIILITAKHIWHCLWTENFAFEGTLWTNQNCRAWL